MSRVERAIRSAITVCCDRGNIKYIEELFGYTINKYSGKPNNSQFISLIVDELKMHNL